MYEVTLVQLRDDARAVLSDAFGIKVLYSYT